MVPRAPPRRRLWPPSRLCLVVSAGLILVAVVLSLVLTLISRPHSKIASHSGGPRPAGVPGSGGAEFYGSDGVGGDEFAPLSENAVKNVTEEPVSTFSADVDTASYCYVRRALSSGRLPPPDAVRAEEMINYFDYGYPLPSGGDRPLEPTVMASDSPWNEGHKLLHIGIKAYDIVSTERRPSNLVFLLDVSGSMSGDDRLPLVKESIELLLAALNPETDFVSIVTYANEARVELEPTSVYYKETILEALHQLEADGGTGGAGGLELAYQMAEQNYDENAVNRIILATDGDFNVGVTDNDHLRAFVEEKRDKGIYLSVLGFGLGNYKDSRMKALANHGNGVAAYIDTINEARKVLVNEAQSTIFPIADDVKIQVEFNPATVSKYRLTGYEKRVLNKEDFNNDKVDAGEIGSGHTVTAIYEISLVGSSATTSDTLHNSTKETLTEQQDNFTGTSESQYAFLKIRYKLPGESESRLFARPISPSDQREVDGSQSSTLLLPEQMPSDRNVTEKFPPISQEFGFATAVASFAQILRGGKYIGNFTYDDVISLAEQNKGQDVYGYRTEFIQMVHTAKEIE